MCHLKSLIFDCISFTECLITSLSTADSEAPASNRTFVTSVCPSVLPGVEVSCPKTINIKQYLNTNNFSSNLHKQHNFILQKYFINNSVVISHKKSFFVTNLVKINIFSFSSITRLKSHPTIHIKYCVLHF